MSSDSETSESLSFAESSDESEDSSEDWRVIESEIRPYHEEPLADISQGHFYWLARFNRKMSFHFPQVFPLISDRSVWQNGKHPLFSKKIWCRKTFWKWILTFVLICSFTANHHSMASGNDLTDSIVSNDDLLNTALLYPKYWQLKYKPQLIHYHYVELWYYDHCTVSLNTAENWTRCKTFSLLTN